MLKSYFFIFLFFAFSFSTNIEASTTPRGLIFLLHGCSQTDDDFKNSTNLEQRLREEGYEIAYIQNKMINNLMNIYRCWEWWETDAITNDSSKMKSYIKEVQVAQAKFNITPEKTYMIGFSSGAAMALNIALCTDNLIGGLALHAGPAFGRAESTSQALDFMKHPRDPRFKNMKGFCDPMDYQGHMLVMHGELDKMVHPHHSTMIMEDLGAKAVITKTCTDALELMQLTVWQKAKQKLHQIIVPKLGHEWGGGNPKYKFTKQDAPSTTEAMVSFLKNL